MELFLKTIGAVNDETRIKILRFIDTEGTVCVCDIEKAFEMIQSRVSKHLKILKDAGFLKVTREGRWAYYSIRSPLDTFRQNILKEISYLEMDIPPAKNNIRRKSEARNEKSTDYVHRKQLSKYHR